MKVFIVLLLMISSLYSQAANLKIIVSEDVESVIVSRWDYGGLVESQTMEKLMSGSEIVVENLESGSIYVLKSGSMKRYFCAVDKGTEVVLHRNQIEFKASVGVNLALEEWYMVSDAVRSQSSEFYRTLSIKSNAAAFFTQYRKLQGIEKQVVEKFRKQLSDDKFEIFNTIVKCDMDYFLYSYFLDPRIAPYFNSYSTFVEDKVRNPSFNSVQFLKYYPDAIPCLRNYVTMAKKCQVSSDELLEQFRTNDLKAFYAYVLAMRVKNFSEISKLKERWKQYFTSQVLSDRFDSIYNNLRSLAIGAPGFNFALPDINDDVVKFSDLKGKVVLVDIWATWCGPCKKEIPYLKKLKEKYKDKDLVLVGISVDIQDLKKKWKNLASSIGGIQLLDSDNTVGAYYKCSAVPHFLLFDKEGQIVSLDAPRPSDPSLKRELNKLLLDKN